MSLNVFLILGLGSTKNQLIAEITGTNIKIQGLLERKSPKV
jgi:hypothetical protein